MSSCGTLQFSGKLPSLYEGRVDTMGPPYCVYKATCVYCISLSVCLEVVAIVAHNLAPPQFLLHRRQERT